MLVKTGETVVLGGLLDDFSKEQVSKVPLLGDIPLVGQLFRYTSTERAKRNLMVFIRPTIIRDDDVYRSLSRREIHPLPPGATAANRREIKSADWLGKICRCWMRTRSTVTLLRHRHGEAFL
ncbi:general secretion pathway protein D [Escherichia coli]|uniref:General secretion pathway protein D n=1 Tax=Escherichia coli TaxID=562 RepID=A0A484Y9K8_ECOLX|nr:general secretion pathway protein D [Escherichia coli]